MDAKVIFFELAGDFKGAKVSRQDQFAGFPALKDQSLYPPMVGTWINNTQYASALNETCGTGRSLSGFYLFDLARKTVAFQPSEPTTPLVGDLGWGEGHGCGHRETHPGCVGDLRT
jgi:hypothetical protein